MKRNVSGYSMKKYRQQGFNLLELLVALGVFVTVVIAFFGVVAISLRAMNRATAKVQTAFLLEEGVEALKLLRDISWQENIKSQVVEYNQCLRFDASSGRYLTTQLNNQLLLHFDETAGATSFADSSGSANSATCTTCPDVGTGQVGYADSEGNFNFKTAALFASAQGDAMLFTSAAPFSFEKTDAFSISAWVKTGDASTQEMPIFNKGLDGSSGATTGYDFSLWRTGGKTVPRFYISDPGGGNIAVRGNGSVDLSLSPASWRHVAVTYKGSSSPSPADIKLYIDGKQEQTTTDANTPISGSFINTIRAKIGARFDSTGSPSGNKRFFNGSLDEVAVHNAELTPTDVWGLYKYNIPVCGLVDNKFARYVVLQNICRAELGTSADILGPVNSMGGCAGYGGSPVVDYDTKKATVFTRWGDPDYTEDFFTIEESVELYLANLFLDS